jgi:MFS family permease
VAQEYRQLLWNILMASASTQRQQVRHDEVETAAWVAAAGCIAVESLAGIMYMFGVYSPILKSRYALSQTELDGLATATNIANNVGLWLGSGIDRLGPRTMMVAGGIVGGLSWLTLWAALTYRWRLAYWQLLVIVICQGHSADAGDVRFLSF